MVITMAALVFACSEQTAQVEHFASKQLDIPAFFTTEIARLSAEKPEVIKTVKKDSIVETKDIKIDNWENELASFLTVDINKPAYAGYLKKDSVDRRVTYHSTNPKLDLKLVEITYNDKGQPITFRIDRNIDNLLYDTEETLHYQKDVGYQLEKRQHVLLLGDKYYHISGKIKQ